MSRNHYIGRHRMLRTPLHRLISRTLAPRKSEGRPRLFEHLCGLGSWMGLTTFLLKRHPTYMILSLATSVYYAWALQGEYETLMHQRINTALEETILTQNDVIDTYESGECIQAKIRANTHHSAIALLTRYTMCLFVTCSFMVQYYDSGGVEQDLSSTTRPSSTEAARWSASNKSASQYQPSGSHRVQVW